MTFSPAAANLSRHRAASRSQHVEGGRQLGVGAVIALPFAVAIGWVFSRVFPVSLVASLAATLLVSASIDHGGRTGCHLVAGEARDRISPQLALWWE